MREHTEGGFQEHEGMRDVDAVIQQFNERLAHHMEHLLSGDGTLEEGVSSLDKDELAVLAAMRALPGDPLERMMLLDEWKEHPDSRFGDAALPALGALVEKGRWVRQKAGKDWRNCLTYPDHVDRGTADKLDRIAVLIDMPDLEDRYPRITAFLEAANKHGLLTKKEISEIRSKLGQSI